MVRLTDIVDKVLRHYPQADPSPIHRAYAFAAQAHEGQKRKSGEPYFVHPASVAALVADMRLDVASVCAALLHDVVEDTDVTLEQIEQAFGEEVAQLVDGVTKLGQLDYACKEDRQAENFRKMLVAMARDIRVLLLKFADRLDNMRTLQHMKPASQERIARETMEIYAPLAGRLGISWLKMELEDLSFRYLEPEAYEDLQRQVKKASRDIERYIADVCKRLRKMLIERGVAVEVDGRRKHLTSIWRKMRAQGIGFEQVHDFIAFRVITENVADCYTALGVIHSQWTPVPGRFKDYIALPKPNMYQSLHTTVIGPGRRRIEVQIRTREMHRIAEYGIAAHWQYKEKAPSKLAAKDAERFAWLRQLVEIQKDLVDPSEFYESLKVDLFPEEVFVFTPAGDVKTLPRGATPLDFAYAVHSEVGHRYAGARVNGAMVSMGYRLRNGDVVEIVTRRDQHPRKDWLDHVVTGKARSRIRTWLRKQEREKAARTGRTLLEKALQKRGASLSRFLKSDALKRVLERYRLESAEELFAKIGFGKLTARQVADLIVPPESEQPPETLRPSLLERAVRRVRQRSQGDGVLIDGMDDILVRFARCCNPVVGDPVVGWITRGRGVTVHRRGCPHSLQLDPERRVEVTWARDSHFELPVAMRVVTADRPGVLARISKVFEQYNVNIREVRSAHGKDGHAVTRFEFTVSDLDRLRDLMRGVRQVQDVVEVERV